MSYFLYLCTVNQSEYNESYKKFLHNSTYRPWKVDIGGQVAGIYKDYTGNGRPDA